MSPRSRAGRASHAAWSICSARPPRVSVMTMRMVSMILPVQAGSALICRSLLTLLIPPVGTVRPGLTGAARVAPPVAAALSKKKVRCSMLGPSWGTNSSKLTLRSSLRDSVWFGANRRRYFKKGSPKPSSTKRTEMPSTGTARPRSTSTHHCSMGSRGSGSQKVVGSPSIMRAASSTLEPARLTPARTK